MRGGVNPSGLNSIRQSGFFLDETERASVIGFSCVFVRACVREWE